jgi:hypothetical protein
MEPHLRSGRRHPGQHELEAVHTVFLAAVLFLAPADFLAGLPGNFLEDSAGELDPELPPVAGPFFRLFTPAITPAAATAAAAATAIPTLALVPFVALVLFVALVAFVLLVALVLAADFFAGDFLVAFAAVAFAGLFLELPLVAAI